MIFNEKERKYIHFIPGNFISLPVLGVLHTNLKEILGRCVDELKSVKILLILNTK